MIKAITIDPFYAGAYKCLINKFPHTQASSFEMFLGWQRFNAPKLMTTNMELWITIKKS
jgi:hypothetical protein